MSKSTVIASMMLVPLLLGLGLGWSWRQRSPSSAHLAILPSPAPSPVPTPSPSLIPPKLLPPEPLDPWAQSQVQAYLKTLEQQGFAASQQGIWIQTADQVLAHHQGTSLRPAASVTKVATTLATLKTFKPDHRFITEIRTTGLLDQGVLQGDLIFIGSGDPFFVWEDAIGLGNVLNQLGIQTITGQLLIQGPFYMNFQTDPQVAGTLLKIGINAALWTPEATQQYQTLPAGTPRPQVQLKGSVQIIPEAPPSEARIKHGSVPVIELLKKMNRYSNNIMADIFTEKVGGATAVAKVAAAASGIPTSEIQLINGSGLGHENRMTPRAAVVMLITLEQLLAPYQLTVGDLFEIVGQDEGVLEKRLLPQLVVAKSGTINQVSTLAGALPTQQQPVIWFVIMNSGYDIEKLRQSQGALLKHFVDWGLPVTQLPSQLTPNTDPLKTLSVNQIITP